MTTPFETSSPFSDNPSLKGLPQSMPPTKDEFIIHTMYDDLEKLKKGDTTFKEQQQTFTTEEKNPVQSVQKEEILKQEEPQQKVPPVDPFLTQLTEKPISSSASAEPESENKKSVAFKVVVAIAAILILAVLGLGIYYYRITKISSKEQQAPTSTPTQIQTPTVTPQPPTETAPSQQTTQAAVQPVDTLPSDKYTTNKPNYLPLDLTTISSDDIKTSLTGIKNDLSTSAPGSLYEFAVVDNNNNPIAFPIFATAAKLNLSPDVLSDLGTNFSLFFYNDAGNIRLGISSDIKNNSSLSQDLQKEEKTFPTDSTLLFLTTTPEIKTGAFNNGSYNNYVIRYLNLNSANTLSIDYTTSASQFFIGTSKNTLRVILDKTDSANTNSPSSAGSLSQ